MNPIHAPTYFELALKHVASAEGSPNSIEQLIKIYASTDSAVRQGWTYRITNLLEDSDPIGRISRICEILVGIAPHCPLAPKALRTFATLMGGADVAKKQLVLSYLKQAEEAQQPIDTAKLKTNLDVA